MDTQTVRISKESHAVLRDLSRRSGKSMQALLAMAIEHIRREHLLDQTNAGYARLRADPEAWEAVTREQEAWEATLADGLSE